MQSLVKIAAQYAVENADKILGSLKNGLLVRKKKKSKCFKSISNGQAMSRLRCNTVYSLVERFQKRYYKALEEFH